MKKIIISMLAMAMFVLSASNVAVAQSMFNSPGAMPTVTVASSSANPCNFGPIDGCWRTSTTARPGDLVGVHIFYQNTSNTPSEGTTLSIKPSGSGRTSSVTFVGGVASLTGPRSVGSATVSLSTPAALTYVSGSAKWYPSATSGPQAVNESGLFGTSGFNIGTVMPGQQGVLVANFRVGDGETVNNDVCRIRNFTADDYTINRGDSTKLRWSTEGCDHAEIYPELGSVALSGSETVRPSRTTTYTLTAYPRDYGLGGTVSRRLTITVVDEIQTNQRPQAITTTASILSTTSARLNGIAVPNTRTAATTAWFEWGPGTSFGYKTTPQSVNLNSLNTPYSATVNGIVPGTNYYYRAVVQNQYGTAYGDPVLFRTQRSVSTTTVVHTPPPQVVVTQQPVTTVSSDVVYAQSAPSLLELRVESLYDRMCINGQMDYTITYRNISGTVLENAVLRFTHPKEVTYISASRGDYEVIDRTITIPLGDIQAGEQGTITVRTRINDSAVQGNLTVTTATVVYTNSITRAQEDAIAYSLITISNDCPNVLGASVYGFGSFLPDTLLEWLLLILVILALVLLARQITKKKVIVV
jgi:hypothetical protein